MGRARAVVGEEAKLLTGRGFSWGQTRMQRLIRSGWNFADQRIWLLGPSCFQNVLGVSQKW